MFNIFKDEEFEREDGMMIRISTFMIFLGKILAGMILTLVLFMIYSFLLFYTDVNTDYERSVVYFASIVGIAFAGFLNAGGKKSNGWFHGILAGTGYLMIILGINKAISGWAINSAFSIICIFAAVTILVGSIGGIIGINLRQKLKD